MIINNKYRINNMAKDLNVKSKELVDLLTDQGFSGRTYMAIMEPVDYNVLFNEITSQKQISSIDDYLNGDIVIERPAEPKPEPKAEQPNKEEAHAKIAEAEAVKPIEAAKAPETMNTAETAKAAEISKPTEAEPVKVSEAPKAEASAPVQNQQTQQALQNRGQNQGQNQNSPRQNQGQNQNQPRQNQGQNQNSPRQNQGQGQNQSRQNQGQNQPRQNQGQGQNQPRQNQGQNQNQPRQNQGQNNQPRQNNGQNQNQPRQNQGQNQNQPRQNQGQSQNQPRQNQGQNNQPRQNNGQQSRVNTPSPEQQKIDEANAARRAQQLQQFNRPIPVAPQKSNKTRDKKPAAPVYKPVPSNEPIKEPIVTTEGSQTRTMGAAKIVDTRSSSVDLSRYDDKTDKLIPESQRELAAEKQKLKKTNTRDTTSKGRDTNVSKGRDTARGRDMKVAGRDINAKGKNDRERAAMERLKKQELEKARKAQLQITIPDAITVSELATRLKVNVAQVVKKLMGYGMMATINQILDYDTAYLVADEMGAKATHEVTVTIEEKLFNEAEDEDDGQIERAPVVVVMGHVDHGKTSLLDRIRHSNVTEGEAGGITQHIGAYRVNINGKDITFLDTPGHEAFTAMRARGAKATDIAILVVAADDGIMPQTIEAINHAKDANLEIIVAINKMDKPGANPDAIMQSLTKYDLVPEAWGGDTMCVPVSAVTGMGINDLLEDILVIAEMKEYKANPNRRAKGIVIESKLDKGRGPVATILVQNGTLRNGDVVIAGTAVGRIRAMTDDKNASVKEAAPSVPVEIFGLDEVPAAGDEFNAVEDERMARELADQRRIKNREDEFKANSKVNLDDLFASISEGVKELKIIVKADVAGSSEAVKQSLEKLSNDEVKVRIIHTGIGGITEGDVMFADASNAIIVGFNVRPDKNALDSADRQKVDIRTYRIIYDCIEEIQAAIKGMLAPTFKENLLGHAEVRQTIHVPNVGTIAGSYVQDGMVKRSSQIRVLRDSVVIFEDKISSLRRFKDDKSEVAAGYECGIGLERFNDIKVGDIFESFEMVEVAK